MKADVLPINTMDKACHGALMENSSFTSLLCLSTTIAVQVNFPLCCSTSVANLALQGRPILAMAWSEDDVPRHPRVNQSPKGCALEEQLRDTFVLGVADQIGDEALQTLVLYAESSRHPLGNECCPNERLRALLA